jgi:glycogen(starch) synthase
MNIAIFASAFYPHFGGVEEACRHLALEYQRRGHGAHIITTRHPQDLPAQETVEGVDVWRFPFEMPRAHPAGMVRFARQFPSDLSALTRLLRTLQTDIIHVQCVGPNGFYALWAARATGLPLVVTTQGERTMDAGRLYQKSVAANWTLRRLLCRADYVTACSRQTLDDAKEFAGFPLDAKSRPVYNGIALEEFDGAPPYAHPRPFILGIGRVVPQKGFDLLIDAYARLQQRLPDAPDLVIAGDGPERPRLQAQADALGLNSRIHLIGRADRPLAVSLFRGCTAFVLPSRQEPQGIVSLEAMACAKPVVAARVGGVPEIVLDGETGLLFPGGNAGALADSLQSLLSDPERAEALGRKGRARAEDHFTWGRIADQYFEIYRQVSRTPAGREGVPCGT